MRALRSQTFTAGGELESPRVGGRSSSKTEFCPVAAVHGSGVHRSAPLLESRVGTGRVRICTRLGLPRFLASMLAEGMPVRAKDFSQSCDEGPRMFPSMNARPGQRVQLPTCVHEVQVGRSFMRIRSEEHT